MKFAGLDFETANMRSGSICAAGCAILEDGTLTQKHEWLIRPAKGYRWMRPDFTEIHGLTYWDVCDCPEFPRIWPELQTMLLAADLVIIHNAPFDLAQLTSVLQLYDLPGLAFDYADTLAISRRLFPEMPSHALDAMAEHFGIRFHHHDAMEDAAACAAIAAKTGVPNDLKRRYNSNEYNHK